MAAWMEEDFEYAARRLDCVLRDIDDCMRWSYDSSCLVSSTTQRTTYKSGSYQLPEYNALAALSQVPHSVDDLQKTEDVSFYDHESIPTCTLPTTEWTFSVAYSHIWHTPILYFTVQMSDGTPLTRQEVVNSLHSYCSDPKSFIDTSDFVSIDEHPVTGIPSYYLHPCQTLKRLEISNANSICPALRLWSWMSMLLPTIGIIIRPTMFLRIQSKLRDAPTN
jgi:hypothetical protein